jgi:AraC-like DNA-binding protein
MCIYNISFHSGERAAGRIVDWSTKKRNKQGLLYIIDGAVVFREEGKKDKIAMANDIVLLPKGKNYTMEYIGAKTSFYLMNFDMLTLPNGEQNLTENIEVIIHTVHPDFLIDLFKKMQKNRNGGNIAAVFKLKEYAYRLLAELFSDGRLSFLPNVPKYSVLLPGIQMLQETFLENIPTKHFAKACNISVSSFRQLFAEYYGISPIQFRNNLRIERAVSLLQDAEMNVKEVAEECGFSNSAYFCRYYKKMVGETPSETRNGKQIGISENQGRRG